MISDAVLIALFSSVPVTITAIATLFVTIRNSTKVEEIHKSTNGMKDALMLITEKEALARGVIQGKAEEKAVGTQDDLVKEALARGVIQGKAELQAKPTA